jgi:GTP pyrophosphokinase
MSDFAQRLASARKQSGLTQSEVAESLGVSFQAVSLWERGETTPEIDKLPELAKMYNVTTDWLLVGTAEEEIAIDFEEPLSDRLFNEERMYTYVKTSAMMKGLKQTVEVLPYARELHKGQVRKGKDQVPYIYHPLLMACHALSMGLDDDNLISAIMLHDVCEDCGVMVEDLPVNDETKIAVQLVTKDDTKNTQEYYQAIAENGIATMVKLIDRCNNVSGMAAAFNKEKLIDYIKETEKYVFPLMRTAKGKYPKYSNQIFLIKYHMTSVLSALKHQLGK